MNNVNDDEQNIEVAADKPKLKALVAELEDLVTTGGYYYSRAGLYYDTRYALWEGQSDDGRKNVADMGEDVFPWDGASDTRVRLADKIIKERKRLRKLAFWGKRVHAEPIGSQNATWAAVVNPLLHWLIYVQNLKMVKRELNLGWSFQDCYGACLMGTFWTRETRLKEHVVEMRQLQAMAAQSGNADMVRAVEAIADPLREEEALAAMAEFTPGVERKELKVFLEELRLTGRGTLQVPYVFKNGPRWLALRPFIDVFFDPAVDDIQSARLIGYREYLTETELRDRVLTEGYDKGWVEEAVTKKGSASFTADSTRFTGTITRSNWRIGTLVDDVKNLIEIWHCYHKQFEKNATVVRCTVLHMDIKEMAGKEEDLDYKHGEYPFDAWLCEEEERAISESRGIPEICLTWQGEQKMVRDYHSDRMSLDILPPLQTPKGQAGSVAMGPAQQLERKRSGDYEFLAIPAMSNTSLLFSGEIEKEVNEYFGRAAQNADPTMVQAARQELVTEALIDLSPVISKTFSLAQQYLSDEEIGMVCGRYGIAYRAGHKDIQGQFDLEFTFDVRTLDTAFLESFSKIIAGTIAPLDRGGVLDYTEIVKILLGAFDPNIAEKVIKNPQAAVLADVKDEQANLAQILTGQEPPMVQSSNPMLRLQTMENTLAQSPRVQKTLGEDETVRALWENRMKMHKFAIAQTQVNPQIGKMGAEPVLGGDGSGFPLGMSRLDRSVENAGG